MCKCLTHCVISPSPIDQFLFIKIGKIISVENDPEINFVVSLGTGLGVA